MGKHGDEQQHHINGLPSAVAGDEDTPLVKKWKKLRCIIVLLFSAAVFLSAVFWLPPFVHYADQKNLHFNSKYKGHDIVASLYVKKPVSLLEDNILQLSDDIFEEIGLPSTKVKILSLDPLPASIITKVVFAVDPDGKYSEMSPASISLIRETFKYLVMGLLNLQLTPSLFGTPSFFQVLKFKGGITIIPQQNAFPLQTVQTLFNFTLNFSIYQLQSNFGELTSQLKSGLHLASYENLYVILSNSEGSTVAAPTIVQSSVLLAVGITPSTERLKQLAQTIIEHHSWNLGLNNTEFGRVKKVRLSSILQHSLHGSGSVPSPSPAPLPHPHRSHHHRPHNHRHDAHILPAISPAPETEEGATPPNVGSPNTARSVPAPRRSYHAQPPNCQFGYYRKRSTQKAQKQVHLTPAVSPTITPHNPVASPKSPVGAPTHVSYPVPALSPLSNVAFAHNEPHTKIEPSAEHSNTLFHGPSPASSSAGCLETDKRTSLLFVALVLLLLHA